ncbi:MAG: hypothetical protein ABSA33_01310, partial [Candidatus Micrarchaeaceae archaeon]
MRYMLLLAPVLFAFAALALSHASYVTMTEPFNATVQQNASIYLGKVGPGQTFYVTISAATQNVSGANVSLGWDELIASGLPQGWLTQNSPLYTTYPSTKISVAPNA